MKSKLIIVGITVLMSILILSNWVSGAIATPSDAPTQTIQVPDTENTKLTIEVTATTILPPTPLFTPTPALELGEVTGRICFPSEYIPAMKAYFQNTKTNQIIEMAIAENQSAYDFDLPSGEYIVSAGLPNFTIKGLYSAYVLCGMGAECSDHTPIRFQVEPDRVTTDVDICDWYSDQDLPTQPVVNLSPTSGQAGTVVQVTASGFPANTAVSVGSGPVDSEFSEVAQGTTDARGKFNLQVSIQGEAGMDWVLAVKAGAAYAVSMPFHITSNAPTATPTPLTVFAPTSGLGKITGRICFPSEHIPAMKAYFQNTATNQIIEMAIAENQLAYEINLPADEYIVYAGLPGSTFRGYYSAYVICGMGAECADHTPIRFRVEPDRVITDVDICDWYAYSDGDLPIQPVVNLSPTSGPSGTIVEVIAYGLPANTVVSVALGPVDSEFSEVGQGTTDANGTFSSQVPIQGEAGMDWVLAVKAGAAYAVSMPFHITSNLPTPTPQMDIWSIYENPRFAVSLQYPGDWQPVPGYGSPETGETRFGAINGFFQISGMDSDSIDTLAAAEAGHILHPYGSQPTIEILQVQGQEARLIVPSDDQPVGMQYQAALIVRYPLPVDIIGTSCRYFVLWADVPHIRTIAQTLLFIR